MPHGGEHRLGAEFAEIRREHESDRPAHLSGIGGIAQQQDQQHKQGRHENGDRPLQTGPHPARHHPHGHGHKQGVPEHQGDGGAQQIAEHGPHPVGVDADKIPTDGVHYIGEGPAGDDAIEREDNEAGEHARPAHQAPVAAGTRLQRQMLHGMGGIALGAPTDHHLGHHDGHADDDNTEQIDQHEGAAAVLAGDVGKFPDIAQPDRGAGGGQDKGHTPRPVGMPRRRGAIACCHTLSPSDASNGADDPMGHRPDSSKFCLLGSRRALARRGG